MAGTFDATIKQLSPANTGTPFTVEAIGNNTAFDALADVEIGSGLNSFATQEDLFVSVQNLSQATVPAKGTFTGALVPANAPRFQEIPLNLAPPAGGWGAPGDVLELVATYKVTAGANTDFSAARSQIFVVV